MMRYLAIAAGACLAVTPPTVLPSWSEWPGLVPMVLKCFLALWLLYEANAALSRWADNRWLWHNDTSPWIWQEEVAVVTGGSKGIGAMVVRELVARGISVAVLDVEPLADGLQNDDSNLITFYRCNVCSRDAVRKAGEAIRSHLGTPTILINNAGIGNANTILEISPERLNSIFQVNIISHWYTVQEFLPGMIAKKKGHVMSTASLAAFLGLAGMVDYSSTKAGLIAFHEGLGQELKHRYNSPQIKTSIVYPGWTRTRLTEGIRDAIRSSGAPIMEPQAVAAAMVEQIISKRSGQLILGPSAVASVRALPTWIQEFVRDRMANVVTVNASTAVA